MSKVYINVGSDFYAENPGMDFLELADEVAKSVKSGNGIDLICCRGENVMVHRGRTKRYIAWRATNFIASFEEVQSTEDMKSTVSIRQVKKLARAFNGMQGRISCFSLIILYVMYEDVVRNGSVNTVRSENFVRFADVMKRLIGAYLEEYPDDILAHFVMDCYQPLKESLDEEIANKKAGDFPPIPKREPIDFLEE